MKTATLNDHVVERLEQPHDLVLAVAVAAWQGERPCPFFFAVIDMGPPVSPRRWWSPSGW
jgi:hypothetical protein